MNMMLDPRDVLSSNLSRMSESQRDLTTLLEDANNRKTVDKADTKIHGNIYTYWAFHDVLLQHKLIRAEGSSNKVLQVDIIFVMIVQILGPPAILIWSVYAINWTNARVGLGNWEYIPGSYERGVSNFACQVLGTFFLFIFILNGIYVIRDDKQKSEKIWYVVKVFQKSSHGTVKRFWLRAGAMINSWCVVISAICMAPCFMLSKSPKDIIFDAFALLFLFRLDDVNGDLGFLEEQWDSDLFGTFYNDIRSQEEEQRRLENAEDGCHDGSSIASDDECGDAWHCSVYTVARQILMILLVCVPLFYVFVEGAEPRHILDRRDDLHNKIQEMSDAIEYLKHELKISKEAR